jgi:hypothetical protein
MSSLEKAARAAQNAVCLAEGLTIWEAEDIARAVLLAVREPDPEAIEAVIGRFDADYSRGSREWLAAVFPALIDAILTPETGGER